MSKRNKIKRTNLHHRKSRSRTGGKPYNGNIEDVPNVIRVDWKKHQAFHLLFPDTDPLMIARELNNIWIDPTNMMICIPKNLAREIVKLYHAQNPL